MGQNWDGIRGRLNDIGDKLGLPRKSPAGDKITDSSNDTTRDSNHEKPSHQSQSKPDVNKNFSEKGDHLTPPNSDSTGSNPSLNTNNNTGSPQAQAQKPLSKVESAQAKIDSLNKMSNKDIGTSVVSSMIKDKQQELKNYKGADLTAKTTAPNWRPKEPERQALRYRSAA